MTELKSGAVIKESDIGVLRTEKVLTPGISPEFLDEVIGATLVKDVTSGSGVQFSDIVKNTL